MNDFVGEVIKILKKLKSQSTVFFNHLEVHMQHVGIKTLEWVSILLLHCASIPSLLSFMSGLVEHPFNVDFVLFIYMALVLLFVKSVLIKDTLNTVTIGIGFVIQSVLMSLILAK